MDGHADIFGDAHRCICRIYPTYVGYNAILSDNAEVDADCGYPHPRGHPQQDQFSFVGRCVGVLAGGLVDKKKTVLICCFPGPVMALLPPQTNVIYKLSFSSTKQLIRPKPTSTLIYKGPLLYTDKRTHLQTTNSNTKRLVKLFTNAKEFCTDVKSNSLQSRRNIINQTAPLCSHSDNCCRIRDGLDRIN